VQRKIVTRADKPKHDARGSIARELIEIDMPKGSAPVKVQLDRSIDLQANRALVRYGDPYGTAVLLLQHGRGHVLVLNALDMFSNPLIGMHDHAEFLWRIVQVENYKPKVYFFDDPKKLSLFDWLRTHAWPAVAGTLLFLAAWLWSAMPRLGPIMPDPQRARRRLLDHLRASGRFLWAHGGSKLLVDAAREACLRRIARVHPDLLGLPESERQAHLKELLGLDAEQAGRLFSAATPARMIDFVHAIRLYQTVQESLARKRLTTQNKKATR
jgi:hypothetical protein